MASIERLGRPGRQCLEAGHRIVDDYAVGKIWERVRLANRIGACWKFILGASSSSRQPRATPGVMEKREYWVTERGHILGVVTFDVRDEVHAKLHGCEETSL